MSEHAQLPQHLTALGFERNPFPQTPDADCYFRTEAIEKQFAEALHCVGAGKGFVLLTGEVGTGKSTFLRRLMDDLLAADCAVSFVFNTFLQGRELLLAINRDFGLAPGANLSEDVSRLNHYLIEQNARGRCCAVVIDDAQNLDAASLELLRLLSNLETRRNKLLQIVLSGQPELLALLRKTESRQLASRIVQHIELAPFSRDETIRYVGFRIARAGSDGSIRLSAGAQSALHRHSRGNPRRMHMIMDRCLYGVLAGARHEIDKRLIEVAAREGGMAPAARRRTRAWLIAAAGGLALAAAGWSSLRPTVPGMVSSAKAVAPAVQPAAPSAQPAAPKPAAAAVKPAPSAKETLQACLKSLNAGAWQGELENGLNVETRRATLQALAREGLVLAVLAPGSRLPDGAAAQPGKLCSWDNRSGLSVLWRPEHPPFDLGAGLRGDAVSWLQARLAAGELYDAEIDGVAGPRTRAALNVFQRQQGIAPDSSVDGGTLFLLEYGIGKRAAGTAPGGQSLIREDASRT